MSVMLYPCILCVALLMDLFVLCFACWTVFVNCFVKQFAICLGVIVILLLNVMELFCVGGGALFVRPYMVFQRMCVLCLCSFHRFCLGFCISEVISSFKSLRTGSQGVCSSYVVSLCELCPVSFLVVGESPSVLL